MIKLSHLLKLMLVSSIVAGGTAGAADMASAAEKDPLRSTLMESKEKKLGVNVHANGATISMVVIALDEHYVTGRSQQSNRIVVRLDRIDGISTSF
jgi:hypothetical protein